MLPSKDGHKGVHSGRDWRHLKHVTLLTNSETEDLARRTARVYDSHKVSGSFGITSDTNVPMLSMPKCFLGNDACQSDAVWQECHTQVYEREQREVSLTSITRRCKGHRTQKIQGW